MNSRKAAAVAMSIIAIACRICGIFMSAMTVLLCFSGLTAKLQIVGFVVELSRALPSAIAGYGVAYIGDLGANGGPLMAGDEDGVIQPRQPREQA